MGGFHEGFFDVVEGGAVAEFGGRGDAAEERGGGIANEPDAPVVVVGEVGGDGAALGDAKFSGEGFHEGAGGVVFGGGGRFGEEAGGDAEAGGALEVGELVVEVFRAGRNCGEELIRVGEVSDGAGVFCGKGGRSGAGGGGVFLLRGGEGGKRGGVGAEGFRGGADAEDFNRDGVVLADQGERIQTSDSTSEDGVEVVEPLGRREGEKEFAAVGVRAGVGHGEDAGGVMAEAGDKFVGEVGRDGRGERVRVLETRVAALDDEAGDDAIPREAGVEGFPVFWSERALGEAGEVDAHERGLRVEELDGGGAAGGGEFGVEAVGERSSGRGLGGGRGVGGAEGEGRREAENENDEESEND